MTLLLPAQASVLLALFALCRLGAAQPIEVIVQKQGERIVIDVKASAAVDAGCAWSVLTDYDHMHEFISNIKASSVTSRQGNAWEVDQTTEARLAFLHFSFHALRAIELEPDKREIRARLIKGDFKSYEYTTRVIDHGGNSVSMTHHGEYVPDRWVPPVIGPDVIRSATHKQYEELLVEMLKRHQAGGSGGPPCGGARTH